MESKNNPTHHIYIYVYVCMYICVCACVYICMYTCIHTYICVYICIYIQAHRYREHVCSCQRQRWEMGYMTDGDQRHKLSAIN